VSVPAAAVKNPLLITVVALCKLTTVHCNAAAAVVVSYWTKMTVN